jgi:cellulose synthase/poly-beta-1,6-N-acetylglucosamine synthase-like glycosyltransferase/chitodextrinase
MVLTPGGGSNRNPSLSNDQRAPDVYANGRGSRTLVPPRPVSPGQQGQQQPGQYPGQRPGERPGQGQGPGSGSGPHSLPGGYGDGRDPYGQGGYGGQNGYDGRNGWDGRNGYDGRNGQPGQQVRPGPSRDRSDAPQRKKKQQSSAKRRKQLGHDRRTKALPMVPKPVSDGRVAMGRLAIIVTVSAWIAYTVNWFFADFFHPGNESAIARTEEVLYLLIVTLLTASAMAYLLSRLGFFYRTRTHHRATRGSLDQYFDTKRPTLTTIIPSYQEEERVIMTTLLTAALQEYPDKSVVLLIDDPYVPKNAKAREQLENARALPAKIERILAEPARRFAGGMASLEIALRRGEIPGHTAMLAVASAYADAIQWLEDFAADQEIVDHTDTFFVNEILLKLAESFREVRTALLDSAGQGVVLHPQMFLRLYRRLVWTFTVRVTSFERKKYVSLSHEPNKAMNLNSYIGLMGGHFREAQVPGGTALVRTKPGTGAHIPDPDYVVTLDADSVLLPEYCLRLVHLLEQQEYQDISITQTPYSSFPGSATRLERIAGATTDLQHIAHQGLTYYDATFWVGANAVIRKKALDQIAESSYTGDYEIKHYIKDRTAIEDTESTIDMGLYGWRLHNYPERLSYSATPPDFGSLCIQRRRWANGGLLILAKLHRVARLRKQKGNRVRFAELFLRWNYMASICWASTSLLILLAFPFSAALISPLLGLVALPYFMAQASDLRYCGYKRIDVLRIYGFNLILLGVNLAGTFSSIVQGITASKASFARAPYVLIGLAGYTLYRAYVHHLTENFVYAALNVVLACYAVKAFIGLRNTIVDTWIHGTSLLYKNPGKRTWLGSIFRRQVEQPKPTDWRDVLQPGISEYQYQTLAGLPVSPPTAPVAQLEAGPSKRRLSFVRVLVALVVLAGAGYGAYAGLRRTSLLSPVLAAPHQTWFAPYVDVTLTPTFQFQSSITDPTRQSVLGFVVAASSARCTPSWGGAYSLDQANQALAIGSRIAQLQQGGQQAIVSFGGKANTSLDVACPTAAALTAAYRSVISTYNLTTIDLDVEGSALDNFGAETRRAQAIAALERADPKLNVWLTLPVEKNGLQGNALSVLASMLRNHVTLAGINIMTMDYTSVPAGTTMGQMAEDALNATAAQLATVYPQYGIRLHTQQIWQRLGATVMIGQNDMRGQNFTIGDAQTLVSFAAANHLGRLSIWSINRDSQCGSSFPETGLLSNTCSGTTQSGLEFTQTFTALKGAAVILPSSGNVQPVAPDTNPADAPYPQWSASASYPLGYKVVENGEIYQAKWYNTGDDPSAQVQFAWQTPWELLGPVLPGGHQSAIFTLPPGTYPAWSQGKAYHTGDKVLYQGLPYEAKWANQGVSPATEASDPSGSAWKALYTIPGEPSGSPAIGVAASPSPSSAVPTTSPSATGSTGATG